MLKFSEAYVDSHAYCIYIYVIYTHCSQKLGDISKLISSNKKREAFDSFLFLLNKNINRTTFFDLSFAFLMFLFNEEKNQMLLFFIRFILILKYPPISVSNIYFCICNALCVKLILNGYVRSSYEFRKVRRLTEEYSI